MIGTTLGEGDAPIVLHNVFCTGNETKLADCQQPTSYYCYGFAPAAGVVCQGEYTNAYTHTYIHTFMHAPTHMHTHT